MAKRSALQKIDEHEKLCRIMQKQTFEQIKEMKERLVAGKNEFTSEEEQVVVILKNIINDLICCNC